METTAALRHPCDAIERPVEVGHWLALRAASMVRSWALPSKAALGLCKSHRLHGCQDERDVWQSPRTFTKRMLGVHA
jgi:hypothetical protein